jgi:ATP-dependent DNA ligase
LYAFDLIELNGGNLRRDPLEICKATLVCVLAKACPGPRVNEYIEADGPSCLPMPARMALECIVLKRKHRATAAAARPIGSRAGRR